MSLTIVKPRGPRDTGERPASFRMADLDFRGGHYVTREAQFWSRVHGLPEWLQRVARCGGDPFYKAQLIYGPFRFRKLRYVNWNKVLARQANRALARLWGIHSTQTVTKVGLRQVALPARDASEATS